MDKFNDQTPTLAEPGCAQPDDRTRLQPDTAPMVAATASVPTLPTGYRLLGELGRGGMGIVYRAEQVDLRRVVALKMILSGEVVLPEHERRFRTEAELIARLAHPNIVQVHDIGTVGERLYLALEFCGGGTLAQHLKGGPLEAAQVARMGWQLADAMAQAHDLKIVHRDLKPANILLTTDSQQVKITDFGLAKYVDTHSTLPGITLGTPAYMPPEQASGLAVGPPADVYALGAILYECLTGRPPFMGTSAVEILHLVVTQEVVPIRQLIPKCPRDLETIVLKCLRKDAQQRYPTAQELAADLQRFLQQQPIHARPVGPVERTIKWVRRNPSLAVLIVLFLAACLCGTLASWYFALVARAAAAQALLAEGVAHQEALTARAAELQSQRDQQQLEWRVYAAQLDKAQRYWDEGNFSAARETLNTTRKDYRGWEYTHLDTLFHLHQFSWRCHEHPMTQMAFSPDGKLLAAGGGDQVVRIWDLTTGLLQSTLVGHTQPVWSIAFSPDGQRLVSGSGDRGQPGLILLSDVTTGQVLHRRPQTYTVWGVAYSPDGTTYATGTGDVNKPGAVIIWDAVTHHARHVWDSLPHAVWSVAYSPDGRRLAAGLGNVEEAGAVLMWELPTGKKKLHCTEHTEAVWSVAFSPDGRYLATGSRDQTVRLRLATTGKIVHTFPKMASWINSLAFSPDGLSLAVGTGNLGKLGELLIWDVPNRRLARQLQGHTQSVWGVAFHPSGTHLAAGVGKLKKYSEARLWDLRPTIHSHPPTTANVVWNVAISPDGRHMAMGSGTEGQPGLVTITDARTGATRLTLRGHPHAVFGLAFSPDGRQLATVSAQSERSPEEEEEASPSGELRLWDTVTGQLLAPPVPWPHPLWSVAFSPDGTQLVTGGGEQGKAGQVTLWDAHRLHPCASMPQPDAVWSVAFSRSGTFIVSGSNDKAVRIWNAPSLTLRREFTHLPNPVFSVALSPDSTRLAAAMGNIDAAGEARVWDVGTGTLVSTLKGHASTIFGIAFTPDGMRLATASGELEKPGEIKLWEVEHGHELLTLRGHTHTVFGLAFCPTGAFLASASRDGTARLWPTDTAPRPQLLSGATFPLERIDYTVDGSAIVGQGTDLQGQPAVQVWDTRTSRSGLAVPTDVSLVGPRHPNHAERLELHLGQPWCVRDEPAAEVQARRTHALQTLLAPRADWHTQHWTQALKARQPFAAAFHVRQLIRHDPTQPLYHWHYAHLQAQQGEWAIAGRATLTGMALLLEPTPAERLPRERLTMPARGE